jgi:serine/threonine protein kinase
MRVTDRDLLTGALARAYQFADLALLRKAYLRVDAAGNGLDLLGALEVEGLEPSWLASLRQVTELVDVLRRDAVFGMIAMRAQLVGGQMLNACMEEGKRDGYRRELSALLADKGVLTHPQAEQVKARTAEVLDGVLARDRQLAEAVDLSREASETGELELAMVLGEVAAKLSFLSKADLEGILRRRARLEQGLPAEEPEAAAPAPDMSLPMPTAPAPAPPPGGATAPPPPAQEEDPIKGYELLEKLGQGAMGAVVKATRRETGEVVALKILKPELAGDDEYVQRFLREAKAVARLSHPNVIRAVQSGRSGEYYFFAMEFVQGHTISELIKAKGRLPERLAIMIVRCVASGLGHAWDHQIVHRDIKPDNVMLTHDGQVKLTDLGLARNAKQDSTLTITGVVMGSPAYISPEQATGEKNLDTRSDLYSLGAALYHMLAGTVPYEADTPLHVMLRHMNDPVPDIRRAVPEVCEATRQLIMKLMAKKAEDRFQHGREVEHAAAAIEEALKRGQEPPITFGQGAGDPTQVTIQDGTVLPTPSASGKVRAPSGSGKSHRPSSSGKVRPKSGKTRFPSGSGKVRPGGDKPKTRPRGVSRKKSEDKDVGERLRRMAAKRKRRF